MARMAMQHHPRGQTHWLDAESHVVLQSVCSRGPGNVCHLTYIAREHMGARCRSEWEVSWSNRGDNGGWRDMQREWRYTYTGWECAQSECPVMRGAKFDSLSVE